ncbi:ABC transporter permease [Lachnoclostridium phytofermentans]|uniref:ABC-2 type transporter n=1 Tax=Lachnoclostridium phytofermentans (strain ATCC 700394 / DSM 18823 / ISDg) TaxID=357809 RepID=A9KQF9_LACP7|nr:ABC transporter permease [Lachnoclostridium phytofermentans]ABX40468.1 ABC-2 type transporter [Lachnoclostridium phytofermentans ISDg]
MTGFFTMFKANVRLLLRNKGFVCCIFFLPLLTLLWLAMPLKYPIESEGINIIEVEAGERILLSMVDIELSIKVYDASDSKSSQYLLDGLLDTGGYSVYREKVTDKTIAQIKEEATLTANRSNLGIQLYLPKDFEERILSGEYKEAILVLKSNEDERIPLLYENLNRLVGDMVELSHIEPPTKEDSIRSYHELLEAKDGSIENRVETVSTKNSRVITAKERHQKENFGYTISFLSLSSLLIGVFITGIFLKEKEYQVLKRITLTQTKIAGYGLAKIILIIPTTMLQTGIYLLGLNTFVKADIGVNNSEFTLMAFGIGFTFQLLSITLGTLFDNILTVSYVAFFAWVFTSTLSGLYFPVEKASSLIKSLSYLMPQSWTIRFFDGIKGANTGIYSMFILIMLAFCIVFLSIGVFGLKITEKE